MGLQIKGSNLYKYREKLQKVLTQEASILESPTSLVGRVNKLRSVNRVGLAFVKALALDTPKQFLYAFAETCNDRIDLKKEEYRK